MIKVMFFARLREQLATDGIELEYEERFTTIDALRTELCLEEGDVWDELLNAPNIICSLNHEVVDADASIKDGDEIAFYPPVTGG